jgi:hypothetical protein
MYKHGADIWSWGEKFDSIEDARADYIVVYSIEVTLT